MYKRHILYDNFQTGSYYENSVLYSIKKKAI